MYTTKLLIQESKKILDLLKLSALQGHWSSKYRNSLLIDVSNDTFLLKSKQKYWL